MKKKFFLISLAVLLIIGILWGTGVIPVQIAKIAGTNYVNKRFPKLEMKCVGVKYSEVYGDYAIKFEDKDGNIHGCIIGPYFFPVSLGQGLFAIVDYYENYD